MAGRGLIALLFTGLSAALGRAYFAYLRRTPFPPDSARLVSVLWFLGALLGLGLALWVLWRGARGRRWLTALLAGVAVASAVPNVALAALFLFAALMGD